LRRARIIIACGCTLASLAAGTAQAATLSVTDGRQYLDIGYDAAAGETNSVSVTYDAAAKTLVLTDSGAATMSAADGNAANEWCTLEPRRITCRFPEAQSRPAFQAKLADRDDSIEVDMDADIVWLYGGAGNDRLTMAGWTRGDLFGDAGDDRLVGGDGSQELDGGTGADLIDGAGGDDSVSFGDADLLGVAALPVPGGVHVRLDGLPNDGHRNGRESDDVRDVEYVTGTAFADVVVGDDDRQVVNALAGDDRVDGGGGNDDIDGGDGNDRLTGGPGADQVYGEFGFPLAPVDVLPADDVLDLRDGGPDSYECGPGTDRVLADTFDRTISGDDVARCESVEVAP
jgi:Ca2+-binding RTX toxin-like protein